MTSSRDDKATVVIDLKSLKQLKKQEDEVMDKLLGELEFATGPDSKIISPETKHNIILFDAGGGLLHEQLSSFPQGHHYHHISAVKELAAKLKTKSIKILIFLYDENPKTVNSLSSQVKSKFPDVKTIILARSLSPQKVKLHQKSLAGASGYSHFPVNKNELQKLFDQLAA